jgi:phosphosulfolactate phosphohydrolase-like enzyme
MGGSRTFKIDAFPGSAFRYLERDAIVCIDVICASTTLVTAVSRGRKAIPAATPDAARALAADLGNAIVAIDGPAPRRPGEIAASPFVLSRRDDLARPVVLSGLSGTELMVNSAGARAVYVASFRNMGATARHLARHHRRVVLLGAGADGDFRCEDQMAAARIGAALVNLGFSCEDPGTAGLVQRWAEIDLGVTTWGKSAAELKRDGRADDLSFILHHTDDLDLVCQYRDGAMAAVPRPDAVRAARLRVVPAGVLVSAAAGATAQSSAP